MALTSTTDTVQWLRDKAESFGRDAERLEASDDVDLKAFVMPYRVVRDELRRCARELHAATS